MTYQFFIGIVVGMGIAFIVFIAAYINLTRDVRREQERLRETRERLAIKEARLV